MTVVATAIASGSSQEAGAEIVSKLREGLAGTEPALVLFFASTAQPLSELAPTLDAAFADAAVLGSSSAGEFVASGDAKGSVAAIAVAGDFEVHGGIGCELSRDAEAAVTAATSAIPKTAEGKPERTALLLLDPFAGNGEEAALLTAALLGEPIRLAGGAAGDDLKMAQTHVSFGDHVATNAVVAAVVFSETPLAVGVCHAHTPITEELEVTRAEGGTIFEVEGRPAWEVWVEKTRDAAKAAGLDPEALADDQIGAYLLRYEAALRSGSELKVRAPLGRGDDGSLSMACAVPQGAKIRICESTPKGQIEAARTASRRAAEQLGGKAAGGIVFDCICRNLILGDSFHEAVTAISEELGGAPIAGFETYGEIALDVGDLSGFHNTTTVVLAFPE